MKTLMLMMFVMFPELEGTVEVCTQTFTHRADETSRAPHARETPRNRRTSPDIADVALKCAVITAGAVNTKKET